MDVFFFGTFTENLDGFPFNLQNVGGDRKPRSQSIAPSVDPPIFLAPRPWWHWPSSFLAPLPWKPNDSMIPKKKQLSMIQDLMKFLGFWPKKIDIAPWSWWWRWIPLNVFSIMSILTSILSDVVTPPRLPTRRIFSSAMAACVDRHSAVFHGGGGSIFWVKKMGISWNSCKRHGFLRSGSAAVFLVGFCCIANFPFLKDARRESKDNKKRWDCWWFRNPANQLRLVLYHPMIYAGFLNHQQKWSAKNDVGEDLTSHDLTPNGGLVREMGPLISGKPRMVKYDSISPDVLSLATRKRYLSLFDGMLLELTMTLDLGGRRP